MSTEASQRVGYSLAVLWHVVGEVVLDLEIGVDGCFRIPVTIHTTNLPGAHWEVVARVTLLERPKSGECRVDSVIAVHISLALSSLETMDSLRCVGAVRGPGVGVAISAIVPQDLVWRASIKEYRLLGGNKKLAR